MRSFQLQSQDPLVQVILDRYLGHDTNDVERRIQKHRKQLLTKLERIKRQCALVETEDGLTSALENRRDIEMDKLVLANLTNSD